MRRGLPGSTVTGLPSGHDVPAASQEPLARAPRRHARPRGSIIGQVLAAFCVFALLIGGAAVAGYMAVSRQNAATSRVSTQYSVLQEANSKLEFDFGNADFAVLYYRLTGERAFLAQFGPARAGFAGAEAVLRRNAIPSVRGLIIRQGQLGTAWFGMVSKLVTSGTRTRAGRPQFATSMRLARDFGAATGAVQDRLNSGIGRVTAASRRSLVTGLAWSAAALAVAVLLVLAASVSTVYTITRPLRRIPATMHRLSAGDRTARAPVTGSAEVRQVAEAINRRADEGDRLLAAESERSRLRAMSREAGLHIREHLTASDVLKAAQLAVEQIVDSDVAYLRLLEGGRFGPVVGHTPAWLLPADGPNADVAGSAIERLRALFDAHTSSVINDLAGDEAAHVPPVLLEAPRNAGVVAQLVIPFGVGSELLGIIVVQRMRPGRPWTSDEVDAIESVAADTGRALNHARLYEAENRLVDDLKALDLAKSSFFATVSHELRAPLTTIEGYVEMLGDEEGGTVTPQQRQMLEAIDRSTVRLRNLIEDVFTLAKLETGAFSTVLRPLDLDDIVRAAADAVRPSVIAGELTLTVTGAADGLKVDGDAGQLERMMINLLSNAVKFTPRGGRIEVTSLSDGGSAVLRVRDTGIGIPATDQKELFNRFFRASNATGRRIPGTGLGLAIVRMIVVNHGGDVEIESREGAGTTVTVRFPLLALAEA
jgi:two-component system, OmpR family, phosphate regulon sensor histidine kinase PhoR